MFMFPQLWLTNEQQGISLAKTSLPKQVSALHHEQLLLLVTISTEQPIILGLPWLKKHNTILSWHKKELLHWSTFCQQNCLDVPHAQLASSSIESPETLMPVITTISGLRPYIDYWGLNQVTVKYPYLLSLIPSALEQLRGDNLHQVWPHQSLQSGPWTTKGISKTRSSDHYDYLVMWYGLSSVPSVFQNHNNDVLSGMLECYVIAFIGATFIYYPSLETHLIHLSVLGWLLKHQLYVKVGKCEFHVPEVKSFGYFISVKGVSMDKGKRSQSPPGLLHYLRVAAVYRLHQFLTSGSSGASVHWQHLSFCC